MKTTTNPQINIAWQSPHGVQWNETRSREEWERRLIHCNDSAKATPYRAVRDLFQSEADAIMKALHPHHTATLIAEIEAMLNKGDHCQNWGCSIYTGEKMVATTHTEPEAWPTDEDITRAAALAHAANSYSLLVEALKEIAAMQNEDASEADEPASAGIARRVLQQVQAGSQTPTTVKPLSEKIILTDAQREAIAKITSRENWYHSYNQPDYAVCSNHVEQQWKKVLRDGTVEKM